MSCDQTSQSEEATGTNSPRKASLKSEEATGTNSPRTPRKASLIWGATRTSSPPKASFKSEEATGTSSPRKASLKSEEAGGTNCLRRVSLRNIVKPKVVVPLRFCLLGKKSKGDVHSPLKKTSMIPADAVEDPSNEERKKSVQALKRLMPLIKDNDLFDTRAVFHGWAIVVQKAMARRGRKWCTSRIGVMNALSDDDEDEHRSEALRGVTALWHECGCPGEFQSRTPSPDQQVSSFDLLEWLVSQADEEDQGSSQDESTSPVSTPLSPVNEQDSSGRIKRGSRDLVPLTAGNKSSRLFPPPIAQTKGPVDMKPRIGSWVTDVGSLDPFNADGSPSDRGGAGYHKDQPQTKSASLSPCSDILVCSDDPFVVERGTSCQSRRSVDSSLHRNAASPKEASRRSQMKPASPSLCFDAFSDDPQEGVHCRSRKSFDTTLHPDSAQTTKTDFHRRLSGGTLPTLLPDSTRTTKPDFHRRHSGGTLHPDSAQTTKPDFHRRHSGGTLHPDSAQTAKPDFHGRTWQSGEERAKRRSLSARTGEEASRRSSCKESSSGSCQDRLSPRHERENYIQKMHELARRASESRVHKNDSLMAQQNEPSPYIVHSRRNHHHRVSTNPLTHLEPRIQNLACLIGAE